MKAKFSLKLICFAALIILIAGNAFSQGRPRPIPKWYDSGKNNNLPVSKPIRQGEIEVTFDKNQKVPYLKLNEIEQVIVENISKKETKMYKTLGKPILLEKGNQFKITFYCLNLLGIKSLSTNALWTSLEELGFLSPVKVEGKADINGKYSDKLSASRTFTTSFEPNNLYYNGGVFNIFVEDAQGKTTKYQLEFSSF